MFPLQIVQGAEEAEGYHLQRATTDKDSCHTLQDFVPEVCDMKTKGPSL